MNYQIQMQARGRGSKNPKILRTSYLEAPLLDVWTDKERRVTRRRGGHCGRAGELPPSPLLAAANEGRLHSANFTLQRPQGNHLENFRLPRGNSTELYSPGAAVVVRSAALTEGGGNDSRLCASYPRSPFHNCYYTTFALHLPRPRSPEGRRKTAPRPREGKSAQGDSVSLSG